MTANPFSAARPGRPVLLAALLAPLVSLAAWALDAPELRIQATPQGDSVEVGLQWDPVPGAHHYRFGSATTGAPRLRETLAGHQLVRRFPGGSRTFQVAAVDAPEPAPLGPAPTPGSPASRVLSLYSSAYANHVVDTWSAPWDAAELTRVVLDGDEHLRYGALGFAAAEFSSQPVDAREFTHFCLDAWVPEPAAGTTSLKVKLVDFGANGVYGGGDDSEHELTLDAASQPALVPGAWQHLEVPLDAFTSLRSRAHLSQLLFSGQTPVVHLDNLFFLQDPAFLPPQAPPAAAPAPPHDPAQVVSLFSGAYADRPVDTWSAPWDQAGQGFLVLGGDSILHYSGMVYAGVEFVSQPLDLTAMTHLHVDVWTPEAVDPPIQLRIKLVDFGANGVWNGGGDDVEGERAFDSGTSPALGSGRWVSLDLPLASFSGLSTRGHLAQIVLSGGVGTLFVDNLYFHDDCPVWQPLLPGDGTLDGTPLGQGGYQLVWQDEFDGPAGQAPDGARWTHDVGTGWGNAQLEWDSDHTSNSSLDGQGHLVLTARRETLNGCAYSSARLVTRDRFMPTHGRVEARIQLPAGQGIWPAFWLLGANIEQVPWPACGEIDILEIRGQEPDLLLGSLHGPGYSGGGSFTRYLRLPGAGFHEDYHVYAVDWSAEAVTWHVDGIPFASARPQDLPGAWVFDHPFYLILNIAVGGSFLGSPDACTVFPQTMKVDWVRVHRLPTAAAGLDSPAGSLDRAGHE